MEDASPAFRTACKTGDIPDGTARMIVLEGTRIAVFHIAGNFFALEDECPHAGASLAHGFVEGNVVRCRIHHWRFSLCDGTYLDEDKKRCNATSFSVRVVGDDVQIAPKI